MAIYSLSIHFNEPVEIPLTVEADTYEEAKQLALQLGGQFTQGLVTVSDIEELTPPLLN